MSHHFLEALSHQLAHQSKHERAHGNKSKASALVYLALGVGTLPIPVIGLPLLAIGFWKLFKKSS